MLFNSIDSTKSGKISKDQFLAVWESEYERLEVAKRMFKLIAKTNPKYLLPEDFKPILRQLLDHHPGLNFLEATPEFQDRYADTVVMRIFYVIDTNDDSKISYRDFK